MPDTVCIPGVMAAINQEPQNLRGVFAMHVHFVWLLGYLKENNNNISCKTILIDNNMTSFFSFSCKTIITLKAPNKNCSKRHFNVLLLSFEENKA